MNERERLLKLIADNNMSAKQFAAEVGIQAGTISNIVNGRNNPSLDVMQRVLNRFRTLSSDWLILGVWAICTEPRVARRIEKTVRQRTSSCNSSNRRYPALAMP